MSYTASDEATADQLAAELDCGPRWTTREDGAELITQLRSLTTDTDPEICAEGQLRLSRLHRHEERPTPNP
ncbi:hypothetical protein [Streptomyces manipurensis]|uniref:hypothetical protein n=1 Tax=Streptomyces manipurensis TaxID=1077945 RepID=UPI003C6EF6AC